VITHPKTEELVESVALWLEEIRPTLDPRNAFLSRVAANALRTVGRELTQGPVADAEGVRLMANLLGGDGTFAELNEELCARIRRGDADASPFREAVRAAVTASIAEKLAVANPRFTAP